MDRDKIAVIAARSRNGVIGFKNQIPWKLPHDLRRFRDITTGGIVIMGRKTQASLPRGFLPNRTNVVITSQTGIRLSQESDFTAPSVPEALREIEARLPCKPIFFIGGTEIFAEGLHYADTLFLTEVDMECEGDAFFPTFSSKEWRKVGSHPDHSRAEPSSHFAVYSKVKPPTF